MTVYGEFAKYVPIGGADERAPPSRERVGVECEGPMISKISHERSSGNVFADIGFSPDDAAELMAKSRLILAISDTLARRKLTQREAARICRTDQPTLSKVLHGRMSDISVNRLMSWMTMLGLED